MKSSQANPPRNKMVFVPLIAAFGLMGATQSALAALTCSYGPTPAVFAVTPPSGSFMVAADAPVGTQLTPWTAWQSPGFSWGCSIPGDSWSGVTSTAAFSGADLTVGKDVYIVMPTSLAGVGLIVENSSIGRKVGVSDTNTMGALVAALRGGFWVRTTGFKWHHTDYAPVEYGHGTRVAFVKTGEIKSGMASVSGLLARVGVYHEPDTDPSHIGQISVSGGATFTVPSCTTPSVTVPLGSQRDTKFPSIGSRAGESGEYSDFWIDFTKCYAHSTSISYSLHPLNGVVANSTGLMSLAPASSARGVGIRIMDRSNHPVAFDTKTSINLSSGSRYIPLRAAMERTGWESFAGGSVLGYADFTMYYD